MVVRFMGIISRPVYEIPIWVTLLCGRLRLFVLQEEDYSATYISQPMNKAGIHKNWLDSFCDLLTSVEIDNGPTSMPMVFAPTFENREKNKV